MAYRVEYAPLRKIRGMEQRRCGKAAFLGLCVMAVCFCICFCRPEGLETLRRLIFPGDTAVTAAALEELSVQLKAGAGITESLRNFCMQIISGA